MIESFASRNSELAGVDGAGWREFAAVKMKRVDTKHSDIEFGIRL